MKEPIKKTSIKDIARESGVTISTVSIIINNSKFVAGATREKVMKAIVKLHYRPNLIAR